MGCHTGHIRTAAGSDDGVSGSWQGGPPTPNDETLPSTGQGPAVVGI